MARLYIRKTDLPAIKPKHRPPFATKLAMAVGLVRWAHALLQAWGQPVWVAADGAYAKRPVRKAVRALGVTAVSRLRTDAALCSVPPARGPRARGRTRVYGPERLSLAKRAGARGGWTTGTVTVHGKAVEKRPDLTG